MFSINIKLFQLAMFKCCLTTLLFTSVHFLSIGQTSGKVYTAADYAFAEKQLGVHTNKLVYRSGVMPQWLPDGRMWYSVNTPSGEAWVIVDPATGKKTEVVNREDLPKEAATASINRRGGGNEVASPDGKQAVYIKDWNLWVKDLATGNERQLTTDGETDFGYATDNVA
jgi:hypothetical protein